jgi:hypothetical protein
MMPQTALSGCHLSYRAKRLTSALGCDFLWPQKTNCATASGPRRTIRASREFADLSSRVSMRRRRSDVDKYSNKGR